MKCLENGILLPTNNTDDEWDEDTLKDWREKMSEPIGYDIVADNSNKVKKVTA